MNMGISGMGVAGWTRAAVVIGLMILALGQSGCVSINRYEVMNSGSLPMVSIETTKTAHFFSPNEEVTKMRLQLRIVDRAGNPISGLPIYLSQPEVSSLGPLLFAQRLQRTDEKGESSADVTLLNSVWQMESFELKFIGHGDSEPNIASGTLVEFWSPLAIEIGLAESDGHLTLRRRDRMVKLVQSDDQNARDVLQAEWTDWSDKNVTNPIVLTKKHARSLRNAEIARREEEKARQHARREEEKARQHAKEEAKAVDAWAEYRSRCDNLKGSKYEIVGTIGPGEYELAEPDTEQTSDSSSSPMYHEGEPVFETTVVHHGEHFLLLTRDTAFSSGGSIDQDFYVEAGKPRRVALKNGFQKKFPTLVESRACRRLISKVKAGCGVTVVDWANNCPALQGVPWGTPVEVKAVQAVGTSNSTDDVYNQVYHP